MRRHFASNRSLYGMIIFCILIVLADVGIFSTGIAENDRLALASMRINASALIRLSRSLGEAPAMFAQNILTPVGLSGDVWPIASVRSGELHRCEEGITENNYYYVECPYSGNATVYIVASRSGVLAPLWRDVRSATATTLPAFAFLIGFAYVTQRQRRKLSAQNAALISRTHMLESTTYAIFHDTRGPLDDMTFARDLLLETLNAEQAEQMGLTDALLLLKQGSERQQSVLEGLGQWLRAGNGADGRVETDLNRLLEKMRENTAYEGTLIVKELPTLSINAEAFRLAVDNLIHNGFKYNHNPDPKVVVHCSGQAILIEDNGDGFDEKEFDRLTQPFQRASQDDEGTGLGLAIARAIIESHGFTLSARSKVGTESTFVIGYG